MAVDTLKPDSGPEGVYVHYLNQIIEMIKIPEYQYKWY